MVHGDVILVPEKAAPATRTTVMTHWPCAVALSAVAVVVSHIQRIGCQPEKTTLHVCQSRSRSAEQGK